MQKYSLRFWLILRCCALHLLVLCVRCDDCNYDLTQCRISGGPGQTSASGNVTCLSDGSLNVSIFIAVDDVDDAWSRRNHITVLYTCQDRHGNEIQRGAVWNNTVTSAGWWLNRTVTVMHQDATCRVYSCYSQDDCYYYSIAMVNAECNFQLASTRITPVTSAQSLDSYPTTTFRNNLPSSSEYFPVTSNTAQTSKVSQVQPQHSIQVSMSTLLLSSRSETTTGVPLQENVIRNSYLTVILPLILVPAGAVGALMVIILCFIGFKHYHRLYTTKLTHCDEVFDPYFNPVDISAGVKVIYTAQSLYSVYDSVRNDVKKEDDSGTEDEKSEILESVTHNNDRSSNISFVMSEGDKNERIIQTDSEMDSNNLGYIREHSKGNGSLLCNGNRILNSKQPLVYHKCCASHPECSCSYNTGRARPDHNISNTVPSMPSSLTSDSSGYVTQNETMSVVSCTSPLFKPAIFKKNQAGYVQENATEVVRLQHLTPSSQSSEENMNGQSSKSYLKECTESDVGQKLTMSFATTEYVFSSALHYDHGIESIKQVISSENSAENETEIHEDDHDLKPFSDDILYECSLSINPSHFDPIDSYI